MNDYTLEDIREDEDEIKRTIEKNGCIRAAEPKKRKFKAESCSYDEAHRVMCLNCTEDVCNGGCRLVGKARSGRGKKNAVS